MKPAITPCAYRFTKCRGYKADGCSVVLCGCGQWACYLTTQELSWPLWQQHFEKANGAGRSR